MALPNPPVCPPQTGEWPRQLTAALVGRALCFLSDINENLLRLGGNGREDLERMVRKEGQRMAIEPILHLPVPLADINNRSRALAEP